MSRSASSPLLDQISMIVNLALVVTLLEHPEVFRIIGGELDGFTLALENAQRPGAAVPAPHSPVSGRRPVVKLGERPPSRARPASDIHRTMAGKHRRRRTLQQLDDEP